LISIASPKKEVSEVPFVERIAKRRAAAQEKLVGKGLGKIEGDGKFVYFIDKGKGRAALDDKGKGPAADDGCAPIDLAGGADPEEHLQVLTALFESKTVSERDPDFKDARKAFWGINAFIKDPRLLERKIDDFEAHLSSFKAKSFQEQEKTRSTLSCFGVAESSALKKRIADQAKREAAIALEADGTVSSAIFANDIKNEIYKFKSDQVKNQGLRDTSRKVTDALSTRSLATSIVESERKNILKIEAQVGVVEANLKELEDEVFAKSSFASIPPQLHRARNILRKSFLHALACLTTSQGRLIENLDLLAKVNGVLVKEGIEACKVCGLRVEDAAKGKADTVGPKDTKCQIGGASYEEGLDIEGYAEALFRSQEEDELGGSSSNSTPVKSTKFKWGTLDHQQSSCEEGESAASAAARALVRLRLLG